MSIISQFKKQHAKTAWYQQASAAKPLYISYAWRACFEFTLNHKKIRPNYKGVLSYLRKDFLDVFFPLETMNKVARFYYLDSNHYVDIEKLFRQWQKNDAPSLRNFILFHSGKLANLTNRQLLAVFEKFSAVYQTLWSEIMFHDAFDAVGSNLLWENLANNSVKLGPNDPHTLTASDELSWLQRERLNLIRLSKKNSKEKKLIEHAEQFHWIYNDYAIVKHLSVRDFINEIKKIRLDPKERAKEESNLRAVFKIREERQLLINRKNIPRAVFLFTNFLVTIAKWRDERKAHTQMATGFLFEIVQELSRRTKIKVTDIEYLWSWEMTKIFKLNPGKVASLRKKRYSGVFYYGNPKNDQAVYGRVALDTFKFMQQLVATGEGIKGQPVYPGIIRGRIRIVRHQKEFKKMKRGDILLAPNTRPEYVPIMKLAGAILSEEGGITSHSAIVSRELKKPCIVGVQGAIVKLKDGDMVEVDADKGVVKLIKKAK